MQIVQSNYTIQTPATGEAVTLVEAKAFCKIETDADDLVVQVMISAAVTMCENITNRTLLPTGFLGEFAGISCSRYEVDPFVDIQRAPVTDVSSVKVYDGNAFADAEFVFRNKDGYPRVLFSNATSIFQRSEVAYPVQIEFTAGYAELPAPLLNAIKAHILFLYENRGDVTPEGGVPMPVEVEMMYRQYRIVGLF